VGAESVYLQSIAPRRSPPPPNLPRRGRDKKRRSLFQFALLFIAFARATSAQTLTLPTNGLYHPGQPIPVTVESPGPGLIQLRGDGIQGIDWPAPGRGSVTVPLTVWRGGGDVTLTLNGKPQTVTLLATESPGTTSPEDAAATRLIARLADDDSLTAWSPGRPIEQRRWLMLAAVAGVLAVGATLPLRRWSGAAASVIVALIACAAIAVFAPSPPARREQRSPDPQFDIVDYYATRPTVIHEAVGLGVWLASAGNNNLASLNPVLECGADGTPMTLRLDLPANGRARLLTRPLR